MTVTGIRAPDGSIHNVLENHTGKRAGVWPTKEDKVGGVAL
jgi:hypothetical protein